MKRKQKEVVFLLYFILLGSFKLALDDVEQSKDEETGRQSNQIDVHINKWIGLQITSHQIVEAEADSMNRPQTDVVTFILSSSKDMIHGMTDE